MKPAVVRHFSVAAVLAAVMLSGSPVLAQSNPEFAIRGYQVEGNTLLPQESISLAVLPYTGPRSSFETIQQALEALEKAYVAAGYASVRIEIPEQDIAQGVVKLIVVEARLQKVLVEGPKFFDEANNRNSLPALIKGQVVNIDDLQRNLTQANESNAKQTNVTFRRAEAGALVDAVVRVVDDNPLRVALSLDNTGNAATGEYRLGISAQYANLFNRDHAVSAQIVSSPQKFDKVLIVGLGYHIPLYRLGHSLDFSLGYSNVDSGQLDAFNISGSGVIVGLRYNQNLARWGEWQHKLSYALDRRAYNNSVVPNGGGASQVPNLTVHPLSLSYSGNLRSPKRDLAGSITWSRNLPGGSNASTADFNQPGGRIGADAAFSTWKFAASITERLDNDWSVRAAMSGQYSADLLIAAEQFGVGGADSVRGFTEREVAADKGLRAGIELWGPDLGPRTGVTSLHLQPLLFYDSAWVRFNQAPGSIESQTISSVGLGVRGSNEKSFSWRLDYALVLRGAQNTAGSTTATGKNSRHLHGSAIWAF